MTTRTDIHRPSAIEPTQYKFIAVHYIGGSQEAGQCYANLEAIKYIRQHMAQTGGTHSNHEHGGTCHICGAMAMYLAVYYHAATNTYIEMGQDCARKMAMEDKAAFAAIRKAIDGARGAIAGKRKAATLLGDAGVAQAWVLYTADWANKDISHEESKIFGIVAGVVKYGSLSEKQIAYINILLDKIDGRADLEAKRAAEKAAALDCPNGRMVVEGVVIKKDYREDGFGGETLKMTVKHADGWVVWGTVPSALQLVEVPRTGLPTTFDDYLKWVNITDAQPAVLAAAQQAFAKLQADPGTVQRGLERGDVVRFTATLTRSDKDSKFGFFKRPALDYRDWYHKPKE